MLHFLIELADVNPDGVFTARVTATSPDKTVTVTIDAYTQGLQADGSPLTEITIVPVTNTATVPTAPAGKTLISIPVDFGPDGATFNPPITVTLPYILPEGTNAADLVIVYYDSATGSWVELTDITIDPVTGTISGKTSHFTLFAVISPEAVEPAPTTPAPTTPAPTTPAPTGTLIVEPTETSTVIYPPATPPATEKEVNWLWPIIGGVVALILMVFVVRYGWSMRRD